MLTILVRPRLLRPGFRVVILIILLLITSRIWPDVAMLLGAGSWLGWLAARPSSETAVIPVAGGAG